MLSRVAERLYWLGRYVERAENTTRLVSVNSHLLMDLPKGIALGWRPLITITGDTELFENHHDEYSERHVVRFLVGDAVNPSSVLSCLQAARENTRTIRDFVPREAWELVNESFLYAKENLLAGLSKRGRHNYLQQIVRYTQSLTGMLEGTMSHDAGYAFLRVGRFIERGDMTTRIIDVRSNTLLPDEASGLRPFENVQWISILKSLTAYQMYRRKVQTRVQRAAALAYLLKDDEFPRSLYRCLTTLETDISTLPRNEGPLRAIARLQRGVKGDDVAPLVHSQQALNDYLDQLQIGLGSLHEVIERTYFLTDLSEPAEPSIATTALNTAFDSDSGPDSGPKLDQNSDPRSDQAARARFDGPQSRLAPSAG